jgi:hypothetical protein
LTSKVTDVTPWSSLTCAVTVTWLPGTTVDGPFKDVCGVIGGACNRRGPKRWCRPGCR